MLIVYHAASGAVIENTGTSSRWHYGPPDEVADRVLARRGFDRDEVGLLRLHDVEDAELVAQVLANRHHVDVEADPPAVVIDGPYPRPEPTPQPDPNNFLLACLGVLGRQKGRVLLREYPEILPALTNHNWSLYRSAVADAHEDGALTADEVDTVRRLEGQFGFPESP